jgi:hypothetical protein
MDRAMAGQNPTRGTPRIMVMTYTIQGGTNHKRFLAYPTNDSLPPFR